MPDTPATVLLDGTIIPYLVRYYIFRCYLVKGTVKREEAIIYAVVMNFGRQVHFVEGVGKAKAKDNHDNY